MLLEIAEPTHVLQVASRDYLARVREFVAHIATGAGVADPDAFARQWHILMRGSIVAAAEGDHLAARRAQEIGQLLLDRAHTRISLYVAPAAKQPAPPLHSRHHASQTHPTPNLGYTSISPCQRRGPLAQWQSS